MAEAAALECRDLVVAYGAEPVLQVAHLRLAQGELVAVLGPSGSGKTTLLHAVAGFVEPRAGQIVIGGRTVSGGAPGSAGMPPERRGIGMVFQHAALWPHLSALDTVAYPFRRRGLAPREAATRAQDLLDRMGIGALAGRRPSELSGGQQQRVGLARALAREADLYLLDEPTAHLDTALRSTLQEEITAHRRAMGAAALYATHDAGEALAVADRVMILRDGAVVQTGTPQQVYDQPVDLWAAQLTGPAAVLPAVLEGREGPRALLTVAGERIVLDVAAGAEVPAAPTEAGGVGCAPVEVMLRPDWTSLGGTLPGVVRQVWYRGPHTDYRLETPAGEVTVRRPGPPAARPGARVRWSAHRAWLTPGATGTRHAPVPTP